MHFLKTTSPSPLLKFGLLNALYPYVYCLRYFSGDVWSEANLRDCVAICMTLSDNLRSDICTEHPGYMTPLRIGKTVI